MHKNQIIFDQTNNIPTKFKRNKVKLKVIVIFDKILKPVLLFPFQVIPPGGNATFDVVFLGRETGLVENTLYIHTSAGSFRYNQTVYILVKQNLI